MIKIYSIFKICKPATIFIAGLLLFLLMGVNNVNGANRYSVATGYWSSTFGANYVWSATSGGPPGASDPVAGDNVYIENGCTVTTSAVTACATISIASGSTLIVARYNLTVSGAISNNGTIRFTSRTGTKTFAGLVTNNNTWINNTVNESITFQGGLTNNGTFNAGTGVYTFSTNNQVFTGTAIIPNVTVTGVTLTNNGTLTVSKALSGSGRLTQGASATLNIGGTSGITSMTATNSGNVVNYTASSNQTVKAIIYRHLGLSGGGTKTMNAATNSINQSFTLSGSVKVTAVVGMTLGIVTLNSGTTFNAGGYTHDVRFDWINNGGTFNPGTGTINFNGTVNQNIKGTASNQIFNNLIVNQSSTKLIIGSANVKVTGTLTMMSGNIDCETNTLELGTSTSSVGTLSYTAGNIIGSFKRWIKTTGTGIQFPLGTSTGSGSATAECNALVTFTNLTNGSLTGKFIATNPGSIGLPLTENSVSIDNQFTEGYWSLIAANGLASTNYTLELTGTNFSSYTEDAEVRIVKRPSGGSSWTLNGTHVAGASSVAKRSGLSGFSEFAHVSSTLCPTSPTTATKNPNTVNVCAGTTITLSSAATGGDDASCTIEYRYSTNGGTNWSSASSSIPSFAAIANGNNIIQARRNNCISACTYPTTWNTVATWAVDVAPVAPTLGSASPTNGSTVCAGYNSGTVTGSGGSGGGSGATNEYQVSINGGTTWSSYISGNTITTTGATGSIIVQARRTGGLTCSNSSWSTICTWTVGSSPVAPTLGSANPANGSVICAGYNSGTVTGSGGSTGATNEYQVSINGGSTYNSYTSGIAISTTGATGSVIIRARGTSGSYGCSVSSWSTICVWTVGSSPVAPTLGSANPANGSVICAGYNSGTVTGSGGSGGSTGATNEYQVSINGGSTYSSYTSGTAITTTGATGSVIVRARRTGGSYGCSVSSWSTICAWTVSLSPVAPILGSANPANGSVICVGYNSGTVIGSGGSGGSTGATNEYQVSINGGSTYSSYTSGTAISTTGATGSVIVQARRTGGSYGCSVSSWSTICAWTVANTVNPTLNVATPASGTAICVGYNGPNATIVAGSGGSGSATDLYEYSINDGNSWSTYISGNTINTTGSITSVQIRVSRSASDYGCGATGPITIVTWPVIANPSIISQPTSPASIPVGEITDNMTVIATGSTPSSLNYQWQYYNGSAWNNVVNGTPIGSIYTGVNSSSFSVAGINNVGNYDYQCIVSASGNGCGTDISNTVTVVVYNNIYIGGNGRGDTLYARNNLCFSNCFNAAINSNWSEVDNWTENTIPSTSERALLIASATVDGDYTHTDLIISNGTTATISSVGSLTITSTITNNTGNSGLVIQSDASGTGSLIHSTNNVAATVQRYIGGSAETWHFLSSPIAAQSISGTWTPTGTYGNGTGYDLYAWNEPTNCWIYKLNTTSPVNWNTIHPGSNFAVGRGYLYATQAANPTKEFIGNLNNDSQSFALTVNSSVDSLKGFNLVGNPYPSSIDWQATSGWTRSNLLSSGSGYDMWIYNKTANNYGVCNSATGSGTNGVTRYIAPMQGFFVRAASAGNLSMDNTVRVHNNAGTWLKNAEENHTVLSVTVQSAKDNSFDEARILFGHSSNQSGAAKLFSPVNTAPSLFMLSFGEYCSVRYLTDTADNPMVPIMFKPGQDGNYILKCNFDVNKFETVMLEDRITHYIQNMKTKNYYNFQSSMSDDVARFILHFGPDDNAYYNELPARIYTDGIHLIIDLTLIGKETEVFVYDAIGRLLLQKTLQGLMQHTINLNGKSQVFTVKLINQQGNISRKLLYNNKYE